MLITDKIRSQLGNWHSLFTDFVQSEAWDNIFRFLKSESSKGKILIPDSSNTFKSFELTDRHKLRALIILMDPYPSMKDTIKIANGIPMDCSNTGVLQPSLEIFHQALEEYCCGFSPEYDYRADISYLLKEEHVMLLNSSLSVEYQKVGSHTQIWLSFMQYFIEKIINKYYRGLPVVLCGLSAQKLEKYFNPMLHHILKIEHPVAASYANRSWNHENCFQWIDNIVQDNNGEVEKIQWWRKKGEGVKEPTKRVYEHKKIPSAKELQMPWED